MPKRDGSKNGTIAVYNEKTAHDIVVLERVRAEILKCSDLKTILNIRDHYAAIKTYLKARNESHSTQISASSIMALAEARAGQLIKDGQEEGVLASVGQPKKVLSQDETILPVTLDKLGISKNQSFRFQMAAEVLSKDPEFFEREREECIKDGIDFTQNRVIRKCRELRCAEVSGNPLVGIEGEYDVIVIDPPWDTTRPEFEERVATDAGFDYPTMSEGELEVLPIPSAPDCHLWCWTTHKFLPMTLRLLGVWGFKYVCTFVWMKTKGMQALGMPYYNCEFAVYARKGTPEFTTTKNFRTCYHWEWKGRRHSEKPESFYELVRRVTEKDGVRRIDMFSRREIEGFKNWGLESPSNEKPSGEGG